MRRFPQTHDVIVALARGDSARRYQAWASRYDTVDETDGVTVAGRNGAAGELPLLSVIVRLQQEDAATTERLVGWLQHQFYDHWEAIFVVGATTSPSVCRILAGIESRDGRFTVRSQVDVPVVETLNVALREANANHAVFLEPTVFPRRHALLLVARAFAENPESVLVYGDDDRINDDGSRSDHYFKPAWSEALLCCRNYLGGLVGCSRARALNVGGFHSELDGEYVWGLALRIAAGADAGAVEHLPFVLTHRDAARAAKSEPGRERAAHAHELRLARIGKRGHVEPVGDASFRVDYELPEEPPRVTVVIPSACKLQHLQPCLDALLHRTSYSNLEVLLVVNEIRKRVPEQREYLEAIGREPRVRVLVYPDRPFNVAWVLNWAAQTAQGEFLCFLNDDTEVIERRWLSAMVARALHDRVAAVGAMLVYPNDRIQHAGVILGVGGIAGHADAGVPRRSPGYHERLLVDQDVSCVTGACMVVRRELFEDVGGFDEALAGAFNDVDFCLRLRSAGWRIVWTPHAELYHRESVSFGRHYSPGRQSEWTAEAALMTTRWHHELISDPYYNPNLSLDRFQLWEPAFPPRVSYPWRGVSPVA